MTASPYASAVPAVELDLDALEQDDDTETAPAPAAGTPLSALASDDDDDDDDDALDQLNAHVVLEDGRSWDVLIVNRDFVAWDMTRAKKKWPASEEAPFLLNTFLAHAASRRAGLYAGALDPFSNEAAVVQVRKAGRKARPTRAGAGPASS